MIQSTKFVTRDYYDKDGTNGIGWCGETGNMIRGCCAVHGRKACEFCYAANGALMQEGNSRSPYQGYGLAVKDKDGVPQWTGRIAPGSEGKWTSFFRTRASGLYFVNSMSDVFHESLDERYILHILRTLHRARWHTFQVLTKRHGRMKKIMDRLYERDGMLQLADSVVPWEQRPTIPNVWFGVTAEDQHAADLGIPFLRKVKAAVRFLSMEPLMERVDIRQHLHRIKWVIVGGESGPHWRPMDLDWARDLRDQCFEAGVPLFFKQEAGADPELLPKLDGEQWPWLPRRPLVECPPEPERRALVQWAEEQYADLIAPWADEMRATAPLVQLGKSKAI